MQGGGWRLEAGWLVGCRLAGCQIGRCWHGGGRIGGCWLGVPCRGLFIVAAEINGCHDDALDLFSGPIYLRKITAGTDRP